MKKYYMFRGFVVLTVLTLSLTTTGVIAANLTGETSSNNSHQFVKENSEIIDVVHKEFHYKHDVNENHDYQNHNLDECQYLDHNRRIHNTESSTNRNHNLDECQYLGHSQDIHNNRENVDHNQRQHRTNQEVTEKSSNETTNSNHGHNSNRNHKNRNHGRH